MILAARSAPSMLTDQPLRRPVVRVEELSKRFSVRRTWVEMLRAPRRRSHAIAVERVSFTVEEGEIVGFLGVNGAGKTTLLKMLSTLILPDSGRAEVMGYDVRLQADEVRRLVAPVSPDERSLDWRLSSRENLRFMGALQGLRGQALHERIEEVLDGVALQDTGSKQVGSFSSGMRQRLLIARALLGRPRVLLLDEPTRSLDPLAARSFRTFLRESIAGPSGCTVLLATHDPEEALELCDRVLILDGGRLVAQGSPAQLSRRVAAPRFRLRTRTPAHPAILRLLGRIASTTGAAQRDDAGLFRLEFNFDDEVSDPADVLCGLVSAGVHVAGFERVDLSLAELIQRVLENREIQHA